LQQIEEQVRRGLTKDTVVDAITKSLIVAASETWRIDVKFEAVKDKY
jgi:hypothetical protein